MNFPTKFEDYAREIIEKLDNPQPDIEQENEGEELWPWPDLDDGFQITTLSEEEYEKEDSPFSDDESQDIVRGINGDGEFAGRGTDFLAFYKSLHFEEMPPFSGKWGIFVFDFGIKYLRDKILNFEPGTFSKAEGAQLAEDFLVRHEQFHFRFDAWVISHEAVTNTPYYENYMRQIYQPLVPSIQVVEESLANRHAYTYSKLKKIKTFMKQFMNSQRGAYRVFDESSVNFDEYCGHLAAEVFEGRRYLSEIPANISIPGANLIPLSHIAAGTGNPHMEHLPYIDLGYRNKLPEHECPTHRVTARGSSIAGRVLPSFSLPGHREAQRFIVDYLAAEPAGRINGHDAFKLDNGEVVKFPNRHGQDRLLKHEHENIVGKAGITMGQFSKERLRTRNWKKHCPRAEPLPSRV